MKGIGAPDLWLTQSSKKIKMNRRIHLRARNDAVQKQQEQELRRERHANRRSY